MLCDKEVINTKLSRLSLRSVEGYTHKIKEDETDRRERGEARVNVVSLARKIVVLRAARRGDGRLSSAGRHSGVRTHGRMAATSKDAPPRRRTRVWRT